MSYFVRGESRNCPVRSIGIGAAVRRRALDHLAGRAARQIDPHGLAVGDDRVRRGLREPNREPVRALLRVLAARSGARAGERVRHRLLERPAHGLDLGPRGDGAVDRRVDATARAAALRGAASDDRSRDRVGMSHDVSYTPACAGRSRRRGQRRARWPLAIARSSVTSRANWSGYSDWPPSESARSGVGCTSTITPSAPAATAARAIGITLSRKPGAVARIGDHRQMRQPLHDRDRRQVEQIARHRVEAANAALAENHLAVPFGEDVLGAHEQIGDRRRHAALEQHRLVDASRRRGAGNSSACCARRSGCSRRIRPRGARPLRRALR